MNKRVDTTQFDAAVARLNPKQRQAVETIEGPVMVVAGPGTGKTQVLTLRIANILHKTDMKPENILALTFTDSGAKAMRERLQRYIGPLAYRVPIFTFHGFADRLIAEYPDAFPRIIGGRPATDIEQIALIEELVMSGSDLKVVRPLGDPTYYVRPLLSIISHLKQEYVSPNDLAHKIEKQEIELHQLEKYHTKGAHKGKVRGEYSALEKAIAKNRELHYVYRLYEATLRERRLYDFNDMITEAVHALRANEDMLRDLQETYQYILADEHQDVNGAQNKILETLASFHDTPNLFVVGDEKQAIYRFQGASLENFLYFADVFKGVTEIALTDNYRSGQKILDCAQALISVDDEHLMALRVPLTAAAVAGAEVTRRDFSHQAIEDDWVVAAVSAELKAGVSAREIAVVVRTNREVEVLTAALRKAGIPVAASADGDILTHPITTTIESLVNAILLREDETALHTVLHGAYWGLTLEEIVKIERATNHETSLISILSNRSMLVEIGVQNVEAATKIVTVLEQARIRSITEAPHRVIEAVLNESGLLDRIMLDDPLEGVRVVRRLFDEIEAMVVRDGVSTLKAVQVALSLRRRYGLTLSAPYITTTHEAVSVMTAHRSKGLEFETVFIPHVHDSLWGGRQHRTLFQVPLARYDVAIDPADDERRLLYVACTRAKRRLILSTSAETIEGREVTPSRLITGLPDSLLEPVSVAAFEADFSPVTALRGTAHETIEPELLVQLLRERGLSATSLNNLLKNPWDFFYRNLLRVPEAKTLSLQFGTVIHAVLERITAYHTTERTWPREAEVLNWFETVLRRQPLSVPEYTQLHEKGLVALMAYLAHLERSTITNTKEELSIQVPFETGLPSIPQITLTGKIDRIDLDAEGRAVRVVDYKTGKPKSRAAIEGETAAADTSYKRQLTFYALLLSLYGDERYRTPHGVLSFVEPTSHGVIKEESFTVSENEIFLLKEEISAAVHDFCTGNFLKDRSLAEASAYAHLATLVVDRV